MVSTMWDTHVMDMKKLFAVPPEAQDWNRWWMGNTAVRRRWGTIISRKSIGLWSLMASWPSWDLFCNVGFQWKKRARDQCGQNNPPWSRRNIPNSNGTGPTRADHRWASLVLIAYWSVLDMTSSSTARPWPTRASQKDVTCSPLCGHVINATT